MGEDSGPQFQVLQSSLKKSKAAAQGVPIGVQLEQSLKFVERPEKRLRVLDEERAKEASLLEEAKQRVERLRSELAAESSAHKAANSSVSEVERLQRQVDELKAQLGQPKERPHKKRTVSMMPSSAEDLASWLEDRQRELQDAVRFGPRNAVLEISSMIADAGERMHAMIIDDPMS